MSKRLIGNLQNLTALKDKIEKNPASLTSANEEFKLLRLHELNLKLYSLEAEYEDDSDHCEELETLRTPLVDNSNVYQIVKEKLEQAESGMTNSTNLQLIKMQTPFTPINAEVLSSPTLYTFLMEIKKKVEGSPLYMSTMRSNMADKILECLSKGNDDVVQQLRLSNTKATCWEAIVKHLISKYGAALRTQDLAIAHHQAFERIGHPLEPQIIKDQLKVIKQHMKACGSLKHMIEYHEKVDSPEKATSFL